MTEAEIYRKSIKRQIREGLLPKYFLAKGKDEQLERTPGTPTRPKGRLTWRQISTLAFLTKAPKMSEADVDTFMEENSELMDDLAKGPEDAKIPISTESKD